MAAAAPSPLASSVEKTNGAKLSRLLIDGGTKVLRNLFDRYHPPAKLVTNLKRHSGTLNDLLRDGYLRRPQWDKLFPSGGVFPDSRNFDITLLFLLLTKICELSSPRGGWHGMPHRRDNSREANIARIKYYRNELYGHVTTTGVDTPTFSTLWREISAALRGLGLNQAEIERLKAERCGEEDYIDVLLEWADSEEDIKSQLKDVRQSQTKVQQTVDEVRKTQLKDREILQDKKVKLEELHQVQAKTQQTVDEVRKTQLEDHEILQESKGRLGESHQFQTITQQTIDKVRQSQLEDRETIQEVYQIDRETHQLVTDVRQTQTDDSRTIQQMCQNTEQGAAKLHEVHMTLRDTKSKVEEISQSHEELLRTQGGNFETLQQQFRQTVENLEDQREIRRQEEILKKLAIIDTQKIMRHYAEGYVEGTRVSIFAKVGLWLNERCSPNRVMVISGNPGMGKSTIAAVTCQWMLQAGRLAGSHFCQYDRARHRNPKVMLQSLACHLSDFLLDYKKALVEKMSRNLGVEINDMEVKDLFELLFEEPLTRLNDPGLTYLMVIDGIDESEYQGRNELLDVIADYFKKLPSWIRFLVTTRPEINIADRLKCLQPVQLEPNSDENFKDIRLCFKDQLHHVLPSENREIILEALVHKSEGVMLYAHYLINLIRKEVTLAPELLDSTLPSGISSVYQSYFERLETNLCKELKITEDQFMNFLSAVAAAREPLPLGFVSKLLQSGTGKSPSAVLRKVNASLSCVSALLPVQDGCIHFFHKSVKDWLIGNSNYKQHQFIVDESEGHRVLSKQCIDELDDVKRKGVEGAQFSDTSRYALQHGVQHMLQLEEDAKVCSLGDVVKNYCLDLELVYMKLCVDVTVASEDILCVQKQEGAEELFEEWQKTLRTLLYLLRKHVNLLKQLPRAIFQILLNGGGPELSLKALNLLETRYSEIPYMECLYKTDLKGFVQTKFECSSVVVCFDVSPQLDYMACQCTDGIIQLWSLHTGKLVWKRRQAHKRWLQFSYRHYFYDLHNIDRNVDLDCYFGDCDVALYRSLVFHPSKDLVLSGTLSHAYTFDGDLKPLFPSSKCCFTVCSVSADKTKMLTNCPDNGESIVMWSLRDGSEITRFSWKKWIISFAWSRDERLLAISDSSGSICLVDTVNGFKPLAKRYSPEECGMIKFSPDCQFLFCLRWTLSENTISNLFCSQIKMESQCSFSLGDFVPIPFYRPWEYESRTENGFLLGDPFCKSKKGVGLSRFVFVLNEKSILRVSESSVIEMLHPDGLTEDGDFSRTRVVFSRDGDILYVISIKRGTVRTFEVSGKELKGEKSIGIHYDLDCKYYMGAVRTGFLFVTMDNTLELLNFELSECIRSWTDIGYINKVIPISEDRVACVVCDDIIILDTTNEDIVSTITTDGEFVGCNSHCQVIVYNIDDTNYRCSLKMHDGKVVLWKILQPLTSYMGKILSVKFSPTEQYCVIIAYEYSPFSDDHFCSLSVLDAVLGRELLVPRYTCYKIDCEFVSDEELVTNFYNASKGDCLQLLNVKSGVVLSEITMESEVYCLAACPLQSLVAVGLEDSKHSFQVLYVKLPWNKDRKENKRIRHQELAMKNASSNFQRSPLTE